MERYTSIFNMLGIKDRSIHSIEDVRNMKPIDYNAVYKRLKYCQDESHTLLSDALNYKN